MIDLTGKSVFVKTQGEYLSVIKMAKLQGFTWAREDHLNPIEIPFPNLLNFYSSKVVTYRDNEKTLCEASEIVEDEEKIKDAVSLVRTFTKNPYKTALTDSFIKSLKLLADTVESQMEEVKQMERFLIDDGIKQLKIVANRYKWSIENADMGSEDANELNADIRNQYVKEYEQIAEWLEELKSYKDIGTLKELKELKENGAFTGLELAKLAIMQKELKKYKDLEKQGLLVRLPCKVGDTVYRVNAGAKQPIIPMTVSEIHFLCYKNERAVRFDAIGKEDMGESCYRLEDIGRIVFLTHEEAERKLEEMKNND